MKSYSPNWIPRLLGVIQGLGPEYTDRPFYNGYTTAYFLKKQTIFLRKAN